MAETIFTKSSRDGRAIEIKAHEYTAGTFIAQVFVGGEFLSGPCDPQPLKTPKGDVTHFLGGGLNDGKPAIGLTTAEAQTISEALKARRAAWKQTAAGRERALLNECDRLIAEYQGAMDEQDAAFERLHDMQETDAAYRARALAEPKVQAAREALQAFYREHSPIRRLAAQELPAEEA